MYIIEKLTIISIIFSMIYIVFNLKVGAIITLLFLLYIFIKKDYIYLIILILFYQSYINSDVLEKDKIYNLKIRKIGEKIEVLKINKKLSKEEYNIKTYDEINNGVFYTISKIEKKYKNIVYLDNYEIKESNLNKYRYFLYKNIEKLDLEYNTENFVKAIILGEKTSLDNSIKNKFNNIGASHILVISGFHIGLIILLLLKIAEFLKFSYRQKYFFTFILLSIYVFLVMFTPSVFRAYIMGSFILFSNIFYEKNEIRKSYCFSMILNLINNPFILRNISFQMSYIALFAIIYSYNYYNKFIGNKYFKLILLSIIIQIYLMPIFLYYFKSIYIFSFIANVVILSYAIFIIPAIFILYFINILSFNFFGILIRYIIERMYHSLYGIVTLFSKIPLMKIDIKYASTIFLMIFTYFLIFFIEYEVRKIIKSNLTKNI
ncbi:ComEC/Rec2-related protein [Hypnocyclicus thermotrophus]|uniref:ComEC/Rec2-related protein n=1 Tax=Hypnocyclicus thermotrophus TaxID=1627895 RepID=A0AA46DX91_9FUSO|nr:ComEC/Rec2 family competence protein [Hypnocyclicus thermotrophus]TDT67867.1 ComEC/Rec2-related protein [Hypnocyclicus thermotrophus]